MLTVPRMLPPPPGDPLLPTGDTAAQLLAAWEKEAPQIIATAMLLCKRGDISALRLVLDRLAPIARGRTLSLDLPKLRTVADVPKINAKLIQFVATGVMTAEEASAMSSVLQSYIEAVSTVEHEARLSAIEKNIEASNASR